MKSDGVAKQVDVDGIDARCHMSRLTVALAGCRVDSFVLRSRRQSDEQHHYMNYHAGKVEGICHILSKYSVLIVRCAKYPGHDGSQYINRWA